MIEIKNPQLSEDLFDLSTKFRHLEKFPPLISNDYWKNHNVFVGYVGGKGITGEDPAILKGYQAIFKVISPFEVEMWNYLNEKDRTKLCEKLKYKIAELSNGNLKATTIEIEKGSIVFIVNIMNYYRNFNDLKFFVENCCAAILSSVEEIGDFFGEFDKENLRRVIVEDQDGISFGAAGIAAAASLIAGVAFFPALLIGGATFFGIKSFAKKINR